MTPDVDYCYEWTILFAHQHNRVIGEILNLLNPRSVASGSSERLHWKGISRAFTKCSCLFALSHYCLFVVASYKAPTLLQAIRVLVSVYLPSIVNTTKDSSHCFPKTCHFAAFSDCDFLHLLFIFFIHLSVLNGAFIDISTATSLLCSWANQT